LVEATDGESSRMRLPFTPEQFFTVFGRYNEAVWPAQWVLAGLGLLALALALRGSTLASRIISGILALLWLWMAVVYHWCFFRAINPGAVLFTAFFSVQAGLLVTLGVRRPLLRVHPHLDIRGIVGGLLIAYAMLAYPTLGYLLGHRYPTAPTFGLPCPTTIFTFGILVWADRQLIPRTLLLVPVLWALIGTVAALQLGVREDLGLPVAAAVATILVATPRAPTDAGLKSM
jgi:hypothetical protein